MRRVLWFFIVGILAWTGCESDGKKAGGASLGIWPVVQPQWPTVGDEAGLDDVVWVPTKTGASAARVAQGNGQWLVVWQDARGGVAAVYGMRILDDGTVLDPIGFPISARSTSSSTPVVAFNGSHFLVAWLDSRNQGSDVYGARVDVNGTVLDPDGISLVVSSYSKGNLALASDGLNFMLAFSHTLSTNPGLYVTRVSPSGVVMDPVGSLVIGSTVSWTNIAWAGTHYLTTFSSGGPVLLASRIGADGTVMDPSGFDIFRGNTLYFNSISSVASEGVDSLVVYHQSFYNVGNVIRAVRVDPDGNHLDDPHRKISMEYRPAGMKYSFSSTSFYEDRYLVAWSDYHVAGDPVASNETADLHANVVFPDGTVMYAEGIPVFTESGHQQYPVLSAGGPGALLVFQDQQRAVNDVRALLLDENAAPVGEPFYVNVAGNAQYRPKMAAGVDGGGVAQKLVLWQDERGVDLDLYAARVDENGVSLDATAIAVVTASGTQLPGGVAFSGGAYWLLWEDLRDGDADVYAARVGTDGTLVDAAGGFVVASGAGDQGAPAVVGDGAGGATVAYVDDAGGESAVWLVDVGAGGSVGTAQQVSDAARPGFAPALARGDGGVFVAWHAFDGLTQQVEGAFVADDGAILWGPQVLAASQSVQLRPTVAWDGARFLVAWEDNRDRVYNVVGVIVEVEGSVSAAVTLGASDANQFLPAAAYDGEHFVVVWEQGTDTGSDIRAQRVDATGAPVDAQPAYVTQGASAERAPAVVADGRRLVSVAYSRPVVEHPYGASRIRLRSVAYNRAPLPQSQMIVTLEDTPVPVTLLAQDDDGDALTYGVTVAPVSGALVGTPPELTYTPAAGFVGEDAFTYRVSDGVAAVDQVVRVLVLAQAQRPVATGASVSTPEDTPLDLVLAGEVAQGAQAVYEVVDAPAHGLFKGTAPDLQYNPDADFAGEDFFTFRVGDGVRESDLAVVRITVTPVNDAPVADAQDLTTPANRVIPLLLTGQDVEGDPLTFAIRAWPAQGTLTGVPPLMSYRPVKNFVGEVTFSFTVSDGELTSEPAIVRITVSDNLRRELDGDASWFGCSASPGVGRGNGKMRRQAAAVHNGNGNGNGDGDGDGARWWSLALLLGLGLALAWGRRRAG